VHYAGLVKGSKFGYAALIIILDHRGEQWGETR